MRTRFPFRKDPKRIHLPMYPWFHHICHQTQLQLPHQLMANESRVDPNEDFSKTVSWLLPAAFQRHESQWESPLTHRPAAFKKNQDPGQEIPSALLIVWISITPCIREQRSEVRGVCRQCWYGRCELGTADVQFHMIWGTYHVLGRRCRFIWMMIMGSCCWVFLSTQIPNENILCTPRKHTYLCRTPLVTYVTFRWKRTPYIFSSMGRGPTWCIHASSDTYS